MKHDLPGVVSCTTYYDHSKKILIEWVWKTFQLAFYRDHTIRGVDNVYAGFWTKSEKNYYACIIHPNGRR
jgi:hypothetical protein